MFFGLLGPVEAWRDGDAVDLGPPQQRALFALLLLHRNGVVSTDRMLDAIWPAGPPRTAVQVLRTYVLRLRGRLREDGLLVTHRHGYELRPGLDQVDADRFESLACAGRAARESGRFDAAAALLGEALALVRGIPLAELGDDFEARDEHRAPASRGSRVSCTRSTARATSWTASRRMRAGTSTCSSRPRASSSRSTAGAASRRWPARATG